MKKIDKQTAWAGIVGVVALVTIVCELVFGGISSTSVSASIKDFMGIAIDIMVFVLAIKIAAKKSDDELLENKLKNALDQWRANNSNMIIQDEEFDKDKDFFSFFMRTDLKNYFGEAKALKKLGWFVRIPKLDSPEYTAQTFNIQFHLNVSTFLDGKIVDDRKAAFSDISGMISAYLQANCKITVDKIAVADTDATITVMVNGFNENKKSGISVDDQIKNFISIIDTAYTCYLVAGNFKV